MNSKALVIAFVVLVSAQSSASWFGIPDSDTMIQGKILWENARQTMQLDQMLSGMRTTMEYAADTTRAVRAASDVVTWVSYPSELGRDLLDDSMRTFDSMFPDGKESRRYAELIKRDIAQTGSGGYNYYALRDAMRSGKKLQTNMTDINARIADKHNVSEDHDKFAKELRGERLDIDRLYSELESAYSSNKLTPQEASVFHARVSALQARALTQMAANQNESSRLDKIRFNNEIEASMKAQEALNKEAKAMESIAPESLSLDPWNYDSARKK